MIEFNVYLRFGTGFERSCRNTRNLLDDERNLTSGGEICPSVLPQLLEKLLTFRRWRI